MKTQNVRTEQKTQELLNLETARAQAAVDDQTHPVVTYLTLNEITILKAIAGTQSKDLETMATQILAKSLLSRITNAANDLARWTR